MGQDQSRAKYERFENPQGNENRAFSSWGNESSNRASSSWKDEQPNRNQQTSSNKSSSKTNNDDKSKNLIQFD